MGTLSGALVAALVSISAGTEPIVRDLGQIAHGDESAFGAILVRGAFGVGVLHEEGGRWLRRAWRPGATLGEPEVLERLPPELHPSFALDSAELTAPVVESSARLHNGRLQDDGRPIGWAPSWARGRDGVHLAYDAWRDGDFDVIHRAPSGAETRVAGSRRFEAHPSIAVDAAGRVWIAWDSAAERWGSGAPLHEDREVHLAVLADGTWHEPAVPLDRARLLAQEREGAPAPALAELPQLVADERGPIWLLARVMTRFRDEGANRGIAWEIRATCLSDRGWSLARTLPASDGPNHDTLAAVALPGGGIAAAYASDGRIARFATHTSWSDAVPGDSEIRAVELFAEGGLPALGAERATGRIDAPTPPTAPDPDPDLGPEGFVRLWGDLHRHSDLSRCKADQDGSLLDQYRYAIDAADLDFVALTDHGQHMTSASWAFARGLADSLDRPGEFAALYGFERALPTGHHNFVSIDRAAASAGPFLPWDPEHPWAGYDPRAWIAIPHQLADNMAPFDWSVPEPELERVAEIFQARRGSFELAGAPLWSFSANRDAPHAADYLARGQRFGFLASSDHVGSGRAFCALYAAARTRAAVFEALKARRCYAATARIALDVRLGALSMGAAGEVAAEEALEIEAAAGGAIASVAVIRNGALAARWPGESAGRGVIGVRVQSWRKPHAFRVSLAGGEILGVQPFLLEPDDQALLEEGSARLRTQPGSLDDDGVRIDVAFEPGAVLTIEPEAIEPEATPADGEERRLALADLALEPVELRLDGTRVEVRLAPAPLGAERFARAWAPGDWRPGDWVYVRLERADGELAWSSPIWIE